MENKLRTIIVTGALRGLAFELSKVLIAEGKHRIILTSREHPHNQKLIDQLKEINKTAEVDYHVLDITNQGSVTHFYQWLQKKYNNFDVLVNNAAIKDSQCGTTDKFEQAQKVLSVNVFSTVHLTEQLLSLLSDDGKIILVSSELGKLHHQREQIQEALTDSNLTRDSIFSLANQFIQMRQSSGQLVGWNENFEPAYFASKALINAYGRFALPKQLKDSQSSFLIHPGWCRTDMGGPNATISAQEGIVSMKHVIDNIQFGRDEKFHAKFYNFDGQIWDF